MQIFVSSIHHSSNHLLIHSFTNSSIHPSIHPSINSSTHPFINQFVHSSIHASLPAYSQLKQFLFALHSKSFSLHARTHTHTHTYTQTHSIESMRFQSNSPPINHSPEDAIFFNRLNQENPTCPSIHPLVHSLAIHSPNACIHHQQCGSTYVVDHCIKTTAQ